MRYLQAIELIEKVKLFLAKHNMTAKEMDKIWLEEAKINWKVKGFVERGKHWSDFPEQTILRLIEKHQALEVQP